MPSLAQHQSNDFVKLLLIGDAKSGKTTSLVSLVEAGYKLRILDMDNLLDSLVFFIRQRCPDKIDNVECRTLRDKRKMTQVGPVIDGSPRAFTDAIKMLDNWKYTEDGTEVDLGVPAQWGPDCILVLDSLSRFCDAAYDWREPLTPKGRQSGEQDARATYGDAQDAVESVLATLTSKNFRSNVIVIAHGMYMKLPDGTEKIFPQGVGQKLSPKIPQYFPSYIRYRNQGGKRTIQLKSDAMIDLASPKPDIPDTLPMDTGLAEFFRLLREQPPTQTKPQPKLATIRK